MEYVVVRGDSIAKIASKTKDPAELIFKANGLDSLMIQPGQKLIIPKGQFSLVINTKKGDVTLVNNGNFFRWYKPLDVKLPAKGGSRSVQDAGEDRVVWRYSRCFGKKIPRKQPMDCHQR
jgi:LysM repeat protein